MLASWSTGDRSSERRGGVKLPDHHRAPRLLITLSRTRARRTESVARIHSGACGRPIRRDYLCRHCCTDRSLLPGALTGHGGLLRVAALLAPTQCAEAERDCAQKHEPQSAVQGRSETLRPSLLHSRGAGRPARCRRIERIERVSRGDLRPPAERGAPRCRGAP